MSSFVKTLKVILAVLTKWPSCYRYRLAKHLQPNLKLYPLNDSSSNKCQSGEVFKAAFYFRQTNTASREYKLSLGILCQLIYGQLFHYVFTLLVTFLVNVNNKSYNCQYVCMFMLFHLLVSSGCTTSVIYVRSSDQRSFVVSIFWLLLPSFFISISESILFHLQRRKLQLFSYWRENDMI